MPRLVRGRQPPRAAAGQRGTRALYCSTQRKEGWKKALVILLSFFCVQSVSARSRSCDQGWQNAYKSGLPSAAIFFILYIYY